ncbi:MAG: helix-turn-helix domain-containing protein [Oligoflexia bacterium]|nr:helix-turn-helix domain-containing protein [Oligoflexia bacterium]
MELPESELVKKVRKLLGMTQKELAGLIGVTTQTVNRWEGGEMSPRQEILKQFQSVKKNSLPYKRAKKELEIIEKLIDFCEEKIRSLSQVNITAGMIQHLPFQKHRNPIQDSILAYHKLREFAYAKVIVVKSKITGEKQIFRISWGMGLPKEFDVYGRSAPKIEPLMSAYKGDEVDLAVGVDKRTKEVIYEEYKVLEVSLLKRFDNHLLLGNYKNFEELKYNIDEHANAQRVIRENLRQYVEEERKHFLDYFNNYKVSDAGTPDLEVTIDDYQELPEWIDTNYLDSAFHMMPTRDQEKSMRWRVDGLVLVEGLGGSGKTSVAIGRTSMICYSDDSSDTKGFFTPETSIGFVLSPSLVRYLQNVCSGKLGLHSMKVKDFEDFRSELLIRRDIFSQGIRRQPNKNHQPDQEIISTTFDWYKLIEKLINKKISKKFQEIFPTNPQDLFPQGLEGIGSNHWKEVINSWQELGDSISNILQIGPLTGIVEKIDLKRENFADTLKESPLWEGVRYSEQRKKLRDESRKIILQAFAYGARYIEVLASPELEAEILKMERFSLTERENCIHLAKQRSLARQLSDADLDCCLLIAHFAGKGYRGRADLKPIYKLAETNYFSSVFVDEVQDFTENQIKLMIEQADPKYKTVTLVGDFRQRLNKLGVSSLKNIATPQESTFLNVNKRQSYLLFKFSSDFRNEIQEDNRPLNGNLPKASDEPPYRIDHSDEELINAILLSRQKRPGCTFSVICKSKKEAEELESKLHDRLWENNLQSQCSESDKLCQRYKIHFTTPLDVKGLEFDTVIVVNIASYTLDNTTERDALYVAISRPRKRLLLTIGGDLSPSLEALVSRHVMNFS